MNVGSVKSDETLVGCDATPFLGTVWLPSESASNALLLSPHYHAAISREVRNSRPGTANIKSIKDLYFAVPGLFGCGRYAFQQCRDSRPQIATRPNPSSPVTRLLSWLHFSTLCISRRSLVKIRDNQHFERINGSLCPVSRGIAQGLPFM